MNVMKIEEIRNFSDEELGSELNRLRRHAFDLRSQAVTEKLEDPSILTTAKRDIARILTIMRQREQDVSSETPPTSSADV